MTECGTPQGYIEGCRGANCLNHRTDLMTCTEAHIRYQGDWAYRKQVDAGTATAEREVFVTATEAARVAKAERLAKGPRVLPEKPHGTTRAQQRACTSDCPNEAAGGLSCTRYLSLVKAEEYEIRMQSARPIVHGTAVGYTLGCHKDSPCPGGDDGLTCTQTMSLSQKQARHRRKQDALEAQRKTAASTIPVGVVTHTEGKAA